MEYFLTYVDSKSTSGIEGCTNNFGFKLTHCYLNSSKVEWLVEVRKTSFDAKVGDTVWVVVVYFNTTDTFGRVDNNWHIVNLYKDKIAADLAVVSIYDGSFKGISPWTDVMDEIVGIDVIKLLVED